MHPLLTGPLRAVTLPEPEQGLARSSSESLARFLPEAGPPLTLRVEDPGTGRQLEIQMPAAGLRVLAETLAQLALGHRLTLVPLEAELSTQHAAEFLGVSRPYFVKLLEQGHIPFRKVGEQRRVRFLELLRYREEHTQAAVAAVAAMSSEHQQLGLYE